VARRARLAAIARVRAGRRAPFLRQSRRCRGRHGRRRCRSGLRAGRAKRAADGPAPRPSDNLAGAASRSGPSAARTGCPAAPREIGRSRAAAAVRSPPTGRRGGVVSPSPRQRTNGFC
jgi:hypothetical protein